MNVAETNKVLPTVFGAEFLPLLSRDEEVTGLSLGSVSGSQAWLHSFSASVAGF